MKLKFFLYIVFIVSWSGLIAMQQSDSHDLQFFSAKIGESEKPHNTVSLNTKKQKNVMQYTRHKRTMSCVDYAMIGSIVLYCGIYVSSNIYLLLYQPQDWNVYNLNPWNII